MPPVLIPGEALWAFASCWKEVNSSLCSLLAFFDVIVLWRLQRAVWSYHNSIGDCSISNKLQIKEIVKSLRGFNG